MFALFLSLMLAHSPAHFTVLKGAQAVLEFSEGSGVLVSTSAPPPVPGSKPSTHPFLHGAALVATEENRLRELLLASKDVPDFVARLRAAGYVVREDRPAKQP